MYTLTSKLRRASLPSRLEEEGAENVRRHAHPCWRDQAHCNTQQEISCPSLCIHLLASPSGTGGIQATVTHVFNCVTVTFWRERLTSSRQAPCQRRNLSLSFVMCVAWRMRFVFGAFPERLQIFPEGTLRCDVAPPVFKARRLAPPGPSTNHLACSSCGGKRHSHSWVLGVTSLPKDAGAKSIFASVRPSSS